MLALWRRGPFLEIGAWAGLSTSVIGHAIKDAGTRKRFVTAEVGPTLDNYRPWGRGVGFFVPATSDVPLGVCSRELFESEIVPVVARAGGVIAELRSNLEKQALSELVEIFHGHFKDVPRLGYDFVFVDASHSENEIRVNWPEIRAVVGDDCVIAFHDTTPDNERVIRSLVPFDRSTRIDSLLICHLRRDSRTRPLSRGVG